MNNLQGIMARLTMMRSLVLGCFFASVYYFFIYDNGNQLVAQISAATASVTQDQNDLKEVQKKLDHAHEYQRSTAEMGETLNRLLSYIPENFRLQDFMKVVSEEAKVAGLNIVRISQDAQPGVAPGALFEELTVTVDLEGTFAQNMTFLANLTKQKQLFTLEHFEMDKQSSPTNTAEAGSPNLSFRAQIKAYRYVGEKAKSS